MPSSGDREAVLTAVFGTAFRTAERASAGRPAAPRGSVPAAPTAVVAGVGVSGRSVVSALLDLGVRVTVTDRDPARLAELVEAVGHAETVTAVVDLTSPPEGTDLVVTTPGWKPDSALHRAAAGAGIDVIGDVELAWRLAETTPAPPPWLTVTGTDGKTTTVGMLEAILLAAGERAVACGNIGLPMLDVVRGVGPDSPGSSDYSVLAVELSSYQLHWQSSVRSRAAVVLNVATDHVDWHGTFEAYAADKAKIYAGAEVAVYNADDEWSTRLAAGHPNRLPFTLDAPTGSAAHGAGIVDGWLVHGGERLVPVAEIRPPGPHNVANALAAAALARVHGVPAGAVRAGLAAYQPPRHRVELVADAAGVRYVNDSKATNTHAALGSVGAFDSVVWIAGGLLHGSPVDDLVAAVAGRLRGVVLLGTDQAPFAAALARHAPDVPVDRIGSGDDDAMVSAVRAAGAMAGHGDVVLLAPAAKSHDMFDSYAHRGTAFTDAVRAVLAGSGTAGDVSAGPGARG